MKYPMLEVIYTWLAPAVRKRTGMLRFKVLGIDFCLYWPMADWGWGFHVLLWGYGVDLDTRSESLGSGWHWVHEDHWYWLPENEK